MDEHWRTMISFRLMMVDGTCLVLAALGHSRHMNMISSRRIHMSMISSRRFRLWYTHAHLSYGLLIDSVSSGLWRHSISSGLWRPCRLMRRWRHELFSLGFGFFVNRLLMCLYLVVHGWSSASSRVGHARAVV
jgi:hypothetical protein